MPKTRSSKSSKTSFLPEQDCSPRGLKFPDEEISPLKDMANELLISKFHRAGLGREPNKTVLILDTPLLRTTKMMFARFPIGIGRLIIVEFDPVRASELHQAILTNGLENLPIEVVNAEVVNWLKSSNEKIDFIWLDLHSSHFALAHTIEHHLNNAECFAVTISCHDNTNGSIANRVERLTQSLEHMLPHKVIDFGYKMSARTQHMQLIAYSKHYSSCVYRMIRNKSGAIAIAGYPNHMARKSTRTRKRRAQF